MLRTLNPNQIFEFNIWFLCIFFIVSAVFFVIGLGLLKSIKERSKEAPQQKPEKTERPPIPEETEDFFNDFP